MASPPDPDGCSFCLATRQHVDYLVAAEVVAICDSCVRGARLPGVWRRFWRWLTGAPTRELTPTEPYRDAAGTTCSFCRRAPGMALRGAKACICKDCVALADDVITEGVRA